jgi:hypothetical protein
LDSKRLQQIIHTAKLAFTVFARELENDGQSLKADQVDKDFAELHRFLWKHVTELDYGEER